MTMQRSMLSPPAQQVITTDAEKERRSWSGLQHPMVQLLFFAIVFWIPFYRWRHLSQQYEFLKVDWLLVLALFAILVPYTLVQRRMPWQLRSNLNLLMGIFLCVNLAASLLSPFRMEALGGMQKIVFGYVFIALGFLIIGRRGFERTFPVVLCTSVSLCAILAIMGFYLQIEMLTLGVTTGIDEFALRGVGGSMGANNAALMYIFCLPFLVHWLHYGRSKLSRFWAVAQIGILLLGLVSTFSRGGFLMLVFIGVLILLGERHRFHPRFLGPAMAFACAFVIIATIAVPDSFVRRIQSLGKGTEADLSMSRRAAYLQVGWDSFKERPILGSGTDTFQYNWFHSTIAKFYKGEMRYAHNTYVEVLVGSGILGLVLFLAILFRAFANYTTALHLFRARGDTHMASLTTAYRIAFVCVVCYLLMLSAIEHKLFLLAIALSQISLNLAAPATSESVSAEEQKRQLTEGAAG